MTKLSTQFRRRHNTKGLEKTLSTFLKSIPRCSYSSFEEFVKYISRGAAVFYLNTLGLHDIGQGELRFISYLIVTKYGEKLKSAFDKICKN